MKTVLLVAAEPREFAGLLRRTARAQRLKWPVDWAYATEHENRRVLMTANGAGRARASQAVEIARMAGELDAVVSTGFCGALDPSLKAGEIFVASAVDEGDRTFPAALPRTAKRYRSGILMSIPRVAQTAAEKSALRAHAADVVDMEAAGAASRAAEAGIPFYCIRAVTDTAAEDFHLDLNAALKPDGHFDAMHLVLSALARPFDRGPELLKLAWRAKLAARNLGDFLATCRF